MLGTLSEMVGGQQKRLTVYPHTLWSLDHDEHYGLPIVVIHHVV